MIVLDVKLNNILGFTDFNHHRAIDDAVMLSRIFSVLLSKGVVKTKGKAYINPDFNFKSKEVERYHIIVLVKNKQGLKNFSKVTEKIENW